MSQPENSSEESSGFTIEDYLDYLEGREQREKEEKSSDLKGWGDEIEDDDRSEEAESADNKQPTWGQLKDRAERAEAENERLRESVRELEERENPELYREAVQIVQYVQSHEEEARKHDGSEKELFEWIADSFSRLTPRTVRRRLNRVELRINGRQGRDHCEDTLRRIFESDLGNTSDDSDS